MKEENEKAGLKLNIQKTKTVASHPIPSWQIDGEKVATVTFYFLGSKITADGYCGREIRKRSLPGRKTVTHLDSILKNRDRGPSSQSYLWFSQQSYTDVRAKPQRRLSTKELLHSNCGAREVS